MPRKKGHYYWTEKHEMLCIEAKNASTQKETTRVYNALLPALNFLVENIMNKYFQVSKSRQATLKSDTVTHIFMKLKMFNPDMKTKAYSFCGTVARNYIFGEIVNRHKERKSVDLEYTDDSEYENNLGIDYGVPDEKNIKQAINNINLRRIAIRDKLQVALAESRHTKYNSMMCILDGCEEFILKYESYDSYGLSDYLKAKCGLTQESIGEYLRQLFGYGSRGVSKKLTSDEIKKFSLVQDDFCPNEDKFQRRDRKREKYDDEDRQYFYF